MQAPTTIAMNRRIAETLDATIEVALHDLDQGQARTIFHGLGRHAGLEAVGAVEQLQGL